MLKTKGLRKAPAEVDPAEPASVKREKNTEKKPSPVRRAFLKRVYRTVEDLGARLSEETLAGVVAASSDASVLLAALESPEATPLLQSGPGERDALAAARLRGVDAKRRLLEAEGTPWTATEAAKHLGISRQAIYKRTVQGKLLGIARGSHGYAYPSWQFTESGTLPGLEKVLRALGKNSPWMKLAFFLGESERMETRRPLDALRKGKLAPILEVAGAYGEQGAD